MAGMDPVLKSLTEMGPTGVARFAESLDPNWIVEALQATGSASIRRRKFPATLVVWLVLGMALFADRSIVEVIDHLRLMLPGVKSISKGAVPPARYRVGPEPLRWLFYTVAEAWAHTPGGEDYRGLSLYGIDGSHIRVPDSDANWEHFGKPGGRNGPDDAAYPQVRVAWLMNLRNRMLVDAEFGPWATSEHTLAEELWSVIPDHSITLVDRGFINYAVFVAHVQEGIDRHILIRMKSNLKYEVAEELPDGTVIGRFSVPHNVRIQYPGLPATFLARVIEYEHPGGEPGRLMTSLLDWEAYPAQELVTLYHERWELEVGYDELKTHMLERKEALRSLKPEGVAQELWGLFTVYNLVRREMLLVAQKRELPANRISFRASLMWIRNFWIIAWGDSPANIPKHLGEIESTFDLLVLPPRRSDRKYPRHVKIKMSNYPRNRGKKRAARKVPKKASKSAK